MARRKKRKGENLSGYFRKLFQEHPHWLHEKSNDLVLAQYREDHGLSPDKALEASVRNNLANLKSKVRREEREGAGAGTTGPRAARGPGLPAEVPSGNDRMAVLEEAIDECLTLAKNLDREGLGHVINLLRRARNAVVWKLGQP